MKVLAVLALAIPIGFAVTFGLWPLWRWFESEWGIESIGREAPAGWCFIATYAALALPAIGWILWRAHVRRA